MEYFIADFWGVLIAAALIVLALIWLMRRRTNKTSIDDQESWAEPGGESIDLAAGVSETGESSAPDTGNASSASGGAPDLAEPAPMAAASPAAEEKAPPQSVSPADRSDLTEPAPMAAASRANDADPSVHDADLTEPAPMAAASPAAQKQPAAAAPAAGADDLQLMKGVGPKLATRLAELGVTNFEQIAAWTENDIAEIDRQLGTFKGRIERDNWVDQASYLARGDREGFEAKYGALGPR